MSDKFTAIGLNVKPGFKLCRNCFDCITKSHDDDLSNDDDTDPDFTLPADQLQKSLSDGFAVVGCSPLKLSKYSKRERSSYVARKVQRLGEACAVAVAVSPDSEPIVTSNIDCPNCQDFEVLISELKEKCVLASKQQKIQLLTFAPPSWSIERTVKEFGVTEYLVKQARHLKQTSGLLSTSEQRKGKCLAGDIVQQVVDFYQEDEVSRLCPGKKEFVSVKIDGIKQQKQKRLLLGNLKEIYLLFKSKYQSSASASSSATKPPISFSKFCELRPKWCVMAGSSGSHSVCVCTIHQNVKLMLTKVGKQLDYHQCIDKIVCSSSNKSCMIHRCEKCPGLNSLEQFLHSQLDEDNDQDDLISFNQWVTTDRTTLVMHQMTVEEFVADLLRKFNKLTVHDYVSRHQSRYLTDLKVSMSTNECIILLDFAENYSFVVQDAAQGYHWDNTQATLHPFVVYFKDQNEVRCTSFCIISNHMKHDVIAVHVFQLKVLEYIKLKMPELSKVFYFSDGCAGQYKNLKNFSNLCHHKEDHGMDAEWNFFATSHGKSACDGIGGTVKRLAARASLQRPLDHQILTPHDLYSWCIENIKNIVFFFIDTSEFTEISKEQEKRFSLAKTIPGTRSFHWFVPLSTMEVQVGYVSGDVSGTFGSHQAACSVTNLQQGQFVACIYDGQWWLGNITEICSDNNDAKVSFMHPHGPAASFFWPTMVDDCWVPIVHILCQVPALLLVGSTARRYKLDSEGLALVSDAWTAFSRTR
jgi:hypothetical protein